MKTENRYHLFPSGLRFLGTLVLLISVALAVPQGSYAAPTSGNATIHNAVTVAYTVNSTTKYVTATVDVKVNTLAVAPTVTVPSGLSVYSGGTVSYTAANSNHQYIFKSNSNGSDTYTLSALTHEIQSSSVSAATPVSNSGNLVLWGGYVIAVGAADTNIIKVPAGSSSGLTADATTGSTIELSIGGTPRKYRVTDITTGNIATTTTGEANSAPSTTADTYDALTLSPIGHAIKADTASVGTQVGEYKSFEVTFTAGTPSALGTDGTYITKFTLTTSAKLADGTTAATVNVTGATTTVYSPSVTVSKKSRNVTTNTSFVTSGTTARPGEVLEYEITVTNVHATLNATNVYITDAIPEYTTAKTGVYDSNSKDVKITNDGTDSFATFDTAGDDDNAALSSGVLTVTLGSGAGNAETPTGGTVNATKSAVVIFQVTVN